MTKLSLLSAVLLSLVSPNSSAFGLLFLSKSEVKVYNECVQSDFEGMFCARAKKYKGVKDRWQSRKLRSDLQQKIVNGNYKRKSSK